MKPLGATDPERLVRVPITRVFHHPVRLPGRPFYRPCFPPVWFEHQVLSTIPVRAIHFPPTRPCSWAFFSSASPVRSPAWTCSWTPVRVPERSYFRHPRSCSRAVLFSGAPVRERFVFSALSLEFRARAPTHRGFLGATQLPARTGLAHPPPAEGTLSEARRHPARLASASPAHPRLPGPRPPSPRRLGDPLRERYLSRSRGSPSPSFIQ